MSKIESPEQLYAIVQRPNLDMPQKLAIIEFIWGEKIPWNSLIYQNHTYKNLERILSKSNQDFIDDMVRFGKPMRNYVRDLWYRLIEVKETFINHHSSDIEQAA